MFGLRVSEAHLSNFEYNTYNPISLMINSYIKDRLFEWFIVLNNLVKISKNLLFELCRRWVERRDGLQIIRPTMSDNRCT